MSEQKTLVAIHHRKGSFSDRWIAFCKENKIDYIIVNAYDTNIIRQLRAVGTTHFMWHISHESSQDLAVSSYVMNSIEGVGIKTFPNFSTRWHFDDKIAQKYLFESKSIDGVVTNVFYNKEEALAFITSEKFPIVAKLKRGAGSTNVKLIKTYEEGKQYINRMFGKGIMSTANALDHFQQKKRVARQIKNPFRLLLKIYNYYKKNKHERSISTPEKGYVYFQEFMPQNTFDTRIIVIGDIAFGIRRFNRDNDFRASGSGKIDFSADEIDIEMIKKAFSTSEKLGSQCAAYDFVYAPNKSCKIIEVCFGFSMLLYDRCEGYWTKDLTFVRGSFNPQAMMISDFLRCE